MRRRRVSFSLIELLISLALVSLLLSFLYQSQKSRALAQHTLEKTRSAVYQRERFFLRLYPVLTKAQSLSWQEGILYVSYDHGIDLQPEFCGVLQSALYREGDTLWLVTWPSRDTAEARIECLWEQVTGFSVALFSEGKWESTASLPEKVRIAVTEKEGQAVYFPYWMAS